MKFNPRMPQQVRQVSEALGILQPKCFSAVTNSPVLPLFAKNPRVRIPPACRRRGATGQLSSTAPHLGCHGNFLEKSCLFAICSPSHAGRANCHPNDAAWEEPFVILTTRLRRADCHPDDPSNARGGRISDSFASAKPVPVSESLHPSSYPPKNPTTRAII